MEGNHFFSELKEEAVWNQGVLNAVGSGTGTQHSETKYDLSSPKYVKEKLHPELIAIVDNLERNVDKLAALSLNQLVKLALRALREASTDPLTDKTCSVAVVGSKDTPFRILSAEELTSALEGLDEQE